MLEYDDYDCEAEELRIQQRLGLARVFLHQPAWIFIEEATDAFTLKEEVDTLELLHHELPSATLLNISRRGRQNHFYDRRLVLERRHESRDASGTAADTSAEA